VQGKRKWWELNRGREDRLRWLTDRRQGIGATVGRAKATAGAGGQAATRWRAGCDATAGAGGQAAARWRALARRYGASRAEAEPIGLAHVEGVRRLLAEGHRRAGRVRRRLWEGEGDGGR
jgi:hypothetical protein